MKTDDTKSILTVAEVAALIDKSPSTVRRWHHQGKIPGGFKLGSRSIRFNAKEVFEWARRLRANKSIRNHEKEGTHDKTGNKEHPANRR